MIRRTMMPKQLLIVVQIKDVQTWIVKQVIYDQCMRTNKLYERASNDSLALKKCLFSDASLEK